MEGYTHEQNAASGDCYGYCLCRNCAYLIVPKSYGMALVKGENKQMKTKAKSILQVIIVVPDALLDGDYEGIWGGYEATFSIRERRYVITTQDGVRGINIPCIVHV